MSLLTKPFSKKFVFDAYDVLEAFCQVRNNKSSRTGTLNFTPRVEFITKILEALDINYEVESFTEPRELEGGVLFEEITQELFTGYVSNLGNYFSLENDEDSGKLRVEFDIQAAHEDGIIRDTQPKYHNIVVKFEASEEINDSILFTAHHDIVNIDSDNCQDNSASVVNLLDLARRIKEENPELNKNVYIIFLDCEETGGRGSRHNATLIDEGKYGDVKFIANSELTAKGDTIWMEPYITNTDYEDKINEINEEVEKKGCPFSDAASYRSVGLKQAICFGILPAEQVQGRFPAIWSLCHSSRDVFDANKEDMANYVDFLFNLINA